MNPRRTLISAGFVFASFFACAQSDSAVYEYEITIYNGLASPSYVVDNKVTGTLDTTLAMVYGHINMEYPESCPVQFNSYYPDYDPVITVYADAGGNFWAYVPVGYCNMSVYTPGYTPFFLYDMQLKPGQERKVDIVIGNAGGYNTMVILSDKPVPDEDILKTQRSWNRKNRKEEKKRNEKFRGI